MFTGIIEGFGTIRDIRPTGLGTRFRIEAGFDLERTKIGDSIAVNGACLTAVTINGRIFEVDVAPETVAMTTFKKAVIGEVVNLERALRLSDRLDGHLVSGHVDGTGTIASKKRLSNAVIVSIKVPESLSNYMIKKGSVAIDGISLTINQVTPSGFEVSIIPHTAEITTIGFKEAGSPVNIETDMIGKYVEKFVCRRPADEERGSAKEGSSIDRDFLARAGFL